MAPKFIALEENFNMDEFLPWAEHQAEFFTSHGSTKIHQSRLVDIHGERLKKMDANNVEYMVLSLTAPGIQDIYDPKEAAAAAKRSNDYLYDQVRKNPKRFGGFAALSMHSPQEAADELTRCVKELGFLGALINNNQRAGKDGQDWVFYDTTEWDVFWAKVQELEVPIYLHPIGATGEIYDKLWAGRRYLVGPVLSFANGVSRSILGMIVNGVFDRFPKLNIIIGHLGEHIPADLWRINHWLEDVHKPRGCPMKLTVYEYFQRNIFITTTGNFCDKTFQFVLGEVGVDRMMFSIDFPYETIEMACQWWSKVEGQINKRDYAAMSRGNAIKLLRLQKTLGT